MAIRQYIGARYVPKFMGTYDPTQVYEALDVVDNGLGTSYISKIPTPAGTPLTNTTYWAIYGASSGAVINLQNQIDDMKDGSVPGSLQDQIDHIAADKIVCIGDSYAIDADAGGTSWATRIKSVYGDRVDLLREGGTGFASDYIPGFSDNWESMLTTYAGGLTTDEKESIKQIIVVGGANDGNVFRDGYATRSQIKAKVTSFINYCKTTFPNAIVKIAFVGWHRQKIRYNAYRDVRDTYDAVAAEHDNSVYCASGESIMHVSSFINNVDMIHPTLEAGYYLAEFVDCVINNTAYSFQCDIDCTFTKNTNIVNVANLTGFHATYADKICQLDWLGSRYNAYFTVILQQGGNINITMGQDIDIGTIEGAPLGAFDHLASTHIRVLAGVYGGTPKWINGLISLQNNTIFFKMLDDDMAISNLLIPWGSLTLNLRNN